MPQHCQHTLRQCHRRTQYAKECNGICHVRFVLQSVQLTVADSDSETETIRLSSMRRAILILPSPSHFNLHYLIQSPPLDSHFDTCKQIFHSPGNGEQNGQARLAI